MKRLIVSQKIFDVFAKFRYPFLIFSIIFMVFNLGSIYKVYVEDIDKQISNKISLRISNLSKEIEGYADIMYSFRGIFAIDPDLTQSEWEVYVSSFNLAQRYPKNTALSYVEILNNNDARKRNLIDLTQSDTHYAVKYTTVANSGPIVTRDLSSDKNRVATLEKARDSGLIFATPPVVSVDTGVKLVVFYMPIYKYNFSDKDATIEDRRENIQGFMSLAIYLDSFLETLFERSAFEDFNITVSDKDAGILYENGLDLQDAQSLKSLNLDLIVANRTWDLEFSTDRMIFLNSSDNLLLYSYIFGRFVAIALVFILLELHYRRIKNNN